MNTRTFSYNSVKSIKSVADAIFARNLAKHAGWNGFGQAPLHLVALGLATEQYHYTTRGNGNYVVTSRVPARLIAKLRKS